MTLDAALANAGVVRWQGEFQAAIRDPRQLCERLDLPPHFQSAAVLAAHQFSVFVPESYLSRMQPGRVEDPLLRQVLPLNEELQRVGGSERYYELITCDEQSCCSVTQPLSTKLDLRYTSR